ncbi:MAG: hypothetical protein J7604_01510 [Sporocytophaga sp.]|uniref:hypothetical protein n=1 Tax=Sporocytophaga sp. TaxID=2231183 RepID=UPI001B0D31D1|nr:hypothetical protein [Sporocytophaga sp.]MBO9698850.1 hypothetical protein [Sporocytophaga sp.]
MNKSNWIFFLIPVVLIGDMLLISPITSLLLSASTTTAVSGFLLALGIFWANMFYIRKVIARLN